MLWLDIVSLDPNVEIQASLAGITAKSAGATLL